ncbi:N-acylneuraminate cytidylyltransferase [Orchesella cincta]|uniref:N-acylneuraminate cytidylyltransferase n=1 Tax=Orchesella cincta TaxID=48709 RepID=A0A1D2NCY3_ORCCI|nr:N-acylneuraminate cytidylyltransferase [Orchesella cincta]
MYLVARALTMITLVFPSYFDWDSDQAVVKSVSSTDSPNSAFHLAGLVLARGGSKGIPKKNLVEINGRPLVGRAIDAMVESAAFTSIWISTDDQDISSWVKREFSKEKISIHNRAAYTATDSATSIVAVLEFLSSHPEIDAVGLVQATSPFVQPSYLKEAATLLHDQHYDSVFSVTRSHQLRWSLIENHSNLKHETTKPLNFNPKSRPRRQDWEGEMVENGMFYFTLRHLLINYQVFQTGSSGYVEIPKHHSMEIDTMEDVELARCLAAKFDQKQTETGTNGQTQLELMAAIDLLRGRQRRYFGYMGNVTHKVDTPESAKSFRSILAPIARTAKRLYIPQKTFKPDPTGPSRFADKIIHKAVQTQIPGLLPALKNSPQFDEIEDCPIYLRSPEFGKQFERSLYHIWLQKQDRNEVCHAVHRHLKAKEKMAKRAWPAKGATQAETEAAAAEQQTFLESLEVDDPKYRARARKRKFQTSYWDPTFNKNLTDPFRRGKNKTPALDSICHEYFGSTEPGVNTCLREYNRRAAFNEDLNAENIDLNEGKEHLRRISLFGTLEEEEKRRGHKHIKQLKEYDQESQALWEKQAKLMISAAEYINKIKQGRRFPTPPREVQRRRKRRDTSPTRSLESSKVESTINIDEYMAKPAHEDTSVKQPPRQLTDVKELRRKMNLDEDHEREKRLVDMLNSDSVEDLHIHGAHHKLVIQHHRLTDIELLHERELLQHHLDRLNNPRLTDLLTRMASAMSLSSSGITMSSEGKEEQGEDDSPTITGFAPAPPPDVGGGDTMRVVVKSADATIAETEEDLDPIGDIPEHELQLIMGEIQDVNADLAIESSSSSPPEDEFEEEGEGETEAQNDEIQLFKKVRKKKDSVAEFMDLTDDFRQQVCKAEAMKGPGKMNPFAEAVCVLYPDGPDKKWKKWKKKTMTVASLRKTLMSAAASKPKF